MSLWNWSELMLACGADTRSADPLTETVEGLVKARIKDGVEGPAIDGISIDTRSLNTGDLFVALSGDPGPRFSSPVVNARDGHDFVSQAQAAGAAGLLVSKKIDSSLPQLHVNDTLDALWLIAEASRQRMEGKVVGITGSSGKTTARAWLEEMLRQQARTHASTGSLNNHWGVPLSLARMATDSAFGIFEIGMNHPGEIEPLARLVNPDVALVLNVLPAHLGSFDNLDGIRKEKLSIANGLSEAGTLVIHEDISLDGCRCEKVVTFGTSPTAMVRGSVSYQGCEAKVTVRIAGNDYSYLIPEGGDHRILTSLACIAVVHALGADVKRACETIPSLDAPVGRGNTILMSGRTIIDDSYNANPVSMKYAIDSLSQRQSGRKIALLGEMLELGEEGKAMHQSVLECCGSLDAVITFGDGFVNAGKSLGDRHWGHYDSSAELDLGELADSLEAGDTILIKGSNKVFWVNNFVEALRSIIG